MKASEVLEEEKLSSFHSDFSMNPFTLSFLPTLTEASAFHTWSEVQVFLTDSGLIMGGLNFPCLFL